MLDARKLLAFGALFAVVAACGGGGSESTPTTPSPEGSQVIATVEMVDFEFRPRQIQVAPGTTVRWVRRGGSPDHTTTAKDGKWDSGFAFRNESGFFEVTFRQADDNQTFEYFCQTHTAQGMKGSVRVGQNAPPPEPGY